MNGHQQNMQKKKAHWDKYFFLLIAVVIIFLLVSFLKFSILSFHTQNPSSNSKKVLLVANSEIYGEMQEAFHNCKAINNLGADCYIFQFGVLLNTPKIFEHFFAFVQRQVNNYIEPDFIVYTFPYMLYEQSNYPVYATLDVGQHESIQIEDNQNLDSTNLEWLKLTDNFIIYGNNQEWANKVISSLNKITLINKDHVLYSFYPTVPQTTFETSKREKLFYSGTNWDWKRSSARFKEIFKNLDTKNYFEVYGRADSWRFLENSYKGEIKFDADSFVNTIHRAGIALLFHSDYHIKYGIPSKRIFEAAAAGAVIISDRNPFVVKEFGNCVYYIDPLKEATEVVKDIDKIVQLIKSDPELANKKAACVHNIFVKKFTLEKQWERVFKMHEKRDKK